MTTASCTHGTSTSLLFLAYRCFGQQREVDQRAGVVGCASPLAAAVRAVKLVALDEGHPAAQAYRIVALRVRRRGGWGEKGDRRIRTKQQRRGLRRRGNLDGDMSIARPTESTPSRVLEWVPFDGGYCPRLVHGRVPALRFCCRGKGEKEAKEVQDSWNEPAAVGATRNGRERIQIVATRLVTRKRATTSKND